jgi:radical SAM superfamily enzyme YgiQ (UPF0313 family)
MRVAYVLPAIGRKPGQKYLKSWLMEPLTVAVLSAITPAGHEKRFFDDRLEQIDYAWPADVVLITVETYTAKRAYAIADEYRSRGVPVILGGYHVTLVPDEAAAHADAVFCGNADALLGEVFADLEAGTLRPRYNGAHHIGYTRPDRTIYASKRKRYVPISLVETGRGCHFDCEFCSIASYYHRRYQHRSVSDIVAEMAEQPNKLFFLVDDSIFSDRAFAKELFTAIEGLHVMWTTQITLDIARDPEALALMKNSGCAMVLIGFESLLAANMEQMNKSWAVKLGEIDELVERVHAAGIAIYASFVFGFDSDSRESFEATFDFCNKHRFFTVAFNHLLTFPGTGTYQRLHEAGSLTSDAWWLEPGYTYGQLAFEPPLMSAKELTATCVEFRKKYHTIPNIIRRSRALFPRKARGLTHLAYWAVNVLFHFEVDARSGIPVGMNLDGVER